MVMARQMVQWCGANEMKMLGYIQVIECVMVQLEEVEIHELCTKGLTKGV